MTNTQGPGETPDNESPRPDVPQYGEYADPSGPPLGQQGTPGAPFAPQPTQAEATGSAAESLGGVGAFVGNSYPQIVGSYTKYEDAQRAVDKLSDDGFPVENVSIVGHDLRTVENVAGRLTNGRAAVRGISGGAWFGLLLGVLFSIFVPGVNFFGVIILAIVLGGVWGALFGFIGHAATRGQRDFASVKTMEAGRYDVLVRGELAARASQMLSEAIYK